MRTTWRATEWSGKSALLATFVTEPPAGIDIVSFFVNSNDPDSNSGDAFLRIVTRQLEAYLDEPADTLHGATAGRLRDLLERAAGEAEGNGRHLLLVVDALDEDVAFTLRGAGLIPIARLLPHGRFQ